MPQSRQLAAIMFTDIVGYTALMGKDEQKAFRSLAQFKGIAQPLVEKFHGHWLVAMLFYRNGKQWWMVDVVTNDGRIQPAAPQLLFEGPYLNCGGPSKK